MILHWILLVRLAEPMCHWQTAFFLRQNCSNLIDKLHICNKVRRNYFRSRKRITDLAICGRVSGSRKMKILLLSVFSRSDKKWVYLLDFSPSSLALVPLRSLKCRAWEEAVFVLPIALYRVSKVKHQLKNREMCCIKHQLTAICTL